MASKRTPRPGRIGGAGATPSVSAASVASPSRWIVDASYDQWFLVGAWLVPFALMALASAFPAGLLVALALFVVLDNSHQVATLPLTLFDPGSMRRIGRVYLGGVAVIGATAIALSLYPQSMATKMWTSLVLYWGAYHIIRQHYGFLRLYQSREKPADERLARMEAVALYSGAAFPYFMNLSHGWAAGGIGAMLVRAPVPVWSAWAVLAVFAASLGYVLVRTLAEGRGVPMRLVHLLLAVSNFWAALLWLGREDLLVATLVITSYHDVQYHAIVWLVGRRRSADAAAPVWPSMRRVFSSPWLFGGAVLAGALVQALLRNDFQLLSSMLALTEPGAVSAAVFALFASYSYMHYFLDGLMWRMGDDPRLRAELAPGTR